MGKIYRQALNMARSKREGNIKKYSLVVGFLLVILLFAVSIFSDVSDVSALPLPGGTLDPATIQKYALPLVIPPAMPKTGIDNYEIAVRQFQQQILPVGMPMTTVWSYGSVNHPWTFNYPAFTIEAQVNNPVRVKWINDLKDPVTGNYLPHLLAVDQTLMWANPPGGVAGKESRGTDPAPYTGPVPIVTHLHGAHVGPKSDGHPKAWFLPAASNIPAGFATKGSHYDQVDSTNVSAGTAVFQYPNDQRATTLWYHDHTIGMTRLNVYAGPAGFYLLRGGTSDIPAGILPGPAPALGDPPGRKYYEIPIVIQDRSFNADGALFYPSSREFFDGFPGPYIPSPSSDISPIWNPEAFFNTMVVNGRTWPFLSVEARKYRFRFLNGSNSRFLILKMVSDPLTDRPASAAMSFWQIGSDGGFLPAPVVLEQLLMGPAERADVIVDFSGLPVGSEIYMINEGPDEPFGGGVPNTDFPAADIGTTGQVMKFVVAPLTAPDTSVNPAILNLPAITPLGFTSSVRQVSLNEEGSALICIIESTGEIVPCDTVGAVPFGPAVAKLGTVDLLGFGTPKIFDDPITENPLLNSTEVWEIHNFTEDAHPIHVHLVQFQIVDRQPIGGTARPPEAWEMGFKDTVIAYPGEITRIKANFDIAGSYVWHCHILEHEDNEMMRPFIVTVPVAPTFSISGTVRTAGGGIGPGGGLGAPVAGVTITLGGAATGTTTTNASGMYTFTGLANGSYSVTPLQAGFAFAPVNRAVVINNANVIGQDFTRSVAAGTFSISGTVTSGGLPQAGVTITLTGAATGTTTTNALGVYTFTSLANGSYTVTPSQGGFLFAPVNRAVVINNANVTGQDFTGTAVPATFSISGTVRTAGGGLGIGGGLGTPVAGVTITLGGAATATTTTNALGVYTFPNLANGSYTVTPSLAGFTFTPVNRAVTINNANMAGQNFTRN